jgi:hypothetical protein
LTEDDQPAEPIGPPTELHVAATNADVTLDQWLASHCYRVLDLKRFGSLVQACVAPQATHWLSPRWKTLPPDVVVTDAEIATWSHKTDLEWPRRL